MQHEALDLPRREAEGGRGCGRVTERHVQWIDAKTTQSNRNRPAEENKAAAEREEEEEEHMLKFRPSPPKR